jgi:hypothetical protein
MDGRCGVEGISRISVDRDCFKEERHQPVRISVSWYKTESRWRHKPVVVTNSTIKLRDSIGAGRSVQYSASRTLLAALIVELLQVMGKPPNPYSIGQRSDHYTGSNKVN